MNTSQATIQRWGNSQGLRLKREVLQPLGLSAGDPVEISVSSGRIVVSPSKKIKKQAVDLKKLLSGVSQNRKVKEVDWGPPVGKEVW